jgi:TorA maturation chaperone TorD
MDAATEAAAISDEDQGRAIFYALIGRLFYAPPDANLLQQIARSRDDADAQAEGGELVLAWQGLQAACAQADADAVRQEHDALFIGVGKALVTPYTSAYVAHSAPDRHLVQLRQQLIDWGLARQDQVFDGEDHISGLCDVMRLLIEENHPLETQKRFFEEYVRVGAMPLCDAVIGAGSAQFYRQAALFALAFFGVEKTAFEMLEADR